MNHLEIEAIEKAMLEEHRKDLEALSRLKRFLPATTKSVPVTIESKTGSLFQADPDLDPLTAPASPTLRGAVERALADNPGRGWTGPQIVALLHGQGFPLEAKTPTSSVAVILTKLVKDGKIRVVRKGGGRAPNIYQWGAEGEGM